MFPNTCKCIASEYVSYYMYFHIVTLQQWHCTWIPFIYSAAWSHSKQLTPSPTMITQTRIPYPIHDPYMHIQTNHSRQHQSPPTKLDPIINVQIINCVLVVDIKLAFSNLVSSTNPDSVICTESWLKHKYYTSDILILDPPPPHQSGNTRSTVYMWGCEDLCIKLYFYETNRSTKITSLLVWYRYMM